MSDGYDGPMNTIQVPRGPALLYVSDDGIVYNLDRLPPATFGVEEDRFPQRDQNILHALWHTFVGPNWMGQRR